MRNTKRWSAAEMFVITNYYRHTPSPLLAKILGRTPSAVRNMASTLGIYAGSKANTKKPIDNNGQITKIAVIRKELR